MSHSFQYPPSDDEFEQTANAHKRHAREIADKLVAGEPLSESEIGFAAIALREWADALPTKPTRRGRPPKINNSTVALLVEGLVRSGMKEHGAKGEAIEILSEGFGVQVEVDTIDNAVKAKGKDAKAHYDLSAPKKSAD